MDKSLQMEIKVINQNLHIFLGFMLADIQVMLEEKTDRVVPLPICRNLNNKTLEHLKIVSGNIQKIRKKIEEKEGEEKVFNAGVEEICPCPVHLRHLKMAGIRTLADFFWPEQPLKLQTVLLFSETEDDSVRQPHLFVGMWLKLVKLVKKQGLIPLRQ